MMTENYLTQEIATHKDVWEKLGIECFAEHPVGQPEKPHRIYLTSKRLGGLLAVNHGEGYQPCYPHQPNYPMKGQWYSPGYWKRREWYKTILAVLDPETHLKGIDPMSKEAAKRRNEKARPTFLCAFTAAVMLGMGFNSDRGKECK